jgi:hypothetical protein
MTEGNDHTDSADNPNNVGSSDENASNHERGNPAPHCPVCGTKMTLAAGSSESSGRSEWSCPKASDHPPPWWEAIPQP